MRNGWEKQDIYHREEKMRAGWAGGFLGSVLLRSVVWKREKNWSLWICGQTLEPLGKIDEKVCFYLI